MNYRERILEHHIPGLLTIFPVVSIVGARQVGKTVLAKKLFSDWQYFDLERADQYDRISLDIEFFFESVQGNICFDEAQRLPVLFSHLRSIVDRYPERRFALLGSASPGLLKSVSESLAGRSATVELFPFSIREVPGEEIIAAWFYGGYPYLRQLHDSEKGEWLRQYIRSFVERDIPALGLSIPPLRLRRLLEMLAHLHGSTLNISQLANAMGCSTTVIYDSLDVLEHAFIIRRLQPFHSSLKKRIVKAPKIYIRDSGILHSLLRLDSHDDLFSHPCVGLSWEGFVIEQITGFLQQSGVNSAVSFWRTHAGCEVDLVLELGSKRLLIEVKLGSITDKRSLKGVQEALDDLSADEAWIVSFRGEAYALGKRIRQISLSEILEELRQEPKGLS